MRRTARPKAVFARRGSLLPSSWPDIGRASHVIFFVASLRIRGPSLQGFRERGSQAARMPLQVLRRRPHSAKLSPTRPVRALERI